MNIQSCLPKGAGFSVAENKCRIVSNEAVNEEYRLLIAEADDVALSARAGQFFHLLCPSVGGEKPFLRRPMSIYRVDPEAGRIGFLYKVTGKGTRALSSLRPDDTIDAMGPLGQGFSLPSGVRNVLMVGRGVGLATLAPLARLATKSEAAVTAVLSARRRDLLMSRQELENAGARVIEVTDEEGTSQPETLEALLCDLHAQLPFDFAATCGSNRLFQLVRSLCAEWNIPGETALEAFMGCGTGMCYACVVPTMDANGKEQYRRVCWDGPVFPISEALGW
ncbi:dihydroorotate dehydrogenase electron transfer subunit [Rhizobium puerariae]|uniref:Dihydroorotate dehydrogenase electron transfer subunit n=1 Tax=Rhizobium puerariae TaxID=1585791 RepID=A0ABV6ABF9_9HYPH